MGSRHRFAIATLLVALTAAVSIVAAPSLPDRIVTHWNAAGVPDGTMSRTLGLALTPALAGVLVVAFALIPRIDPLGENIAEFRAVYDWFVVAFTAFMAVIHVGVVAFNLGYRFDFTLLVLAAVSLLLYFVGVLLGHARRNWFVGIRTPWTMSNTEVWDRTHALAAQLFKLTAVLGLVGLLFGDLAVYFLLVPALLTAVATVAYSYYAYVQLNGASDAATETAP